MFRPLIFAILILPSQFLHAQFGFQRINSIDVFEAAILQKYAWAGGMDYCQFSNIDLDFDGVEDLFVFDRSNDKVLTFLQKGAPGSFDYEYAPQYESKFPEYNRVYDPYEDEDYLFNWVLLVDYNCDGKKDIFTSRSGGIKVFKNTGNAIDGLSFEITSLRLKSFQYTMQQYLYVSAADLPGVVDIDGDGDVDIITFGGTGQALEYHRNMSMETYGICDSLLFAMKNTCWGRFRESATTNAVTLFDTLAYPCNQTSYNLESWRPSGIEDRHEGSTVLPLDLNGNGVMDLILGDIAYTNLVALTNGGTAPNLNSSMTSFDAAYPSNSLTADVTIYPGAYHVDINNDGNRDLIVTPSSRIGSENRTATWYYLNRDTDLNPVFEFQQNDFLQGLMIDVGSRSLPVFFDHNGDGLKDLLVSCAGHFNPLTGNQFCTIYYYQNTGTATNPVFTLITEDYMGISQMGIGYSLFFYPTFGDLDNDGDEDMILGEYSGYCYYLQNTGGAGNPAIFNTFILLPNNLSTPLVTPDNAGIFIAPTLVDLDRDGDLDLVVGRRNGKLNYYENIGNASNYSFLFLTNSLGGVNVSEWWSIEGLAVPQFVEIAGDYKLIVGSKTGYLHYYDQIEGNIGGYFNLVDSTLDNINTGTYSAPAITNLDGDDTFEMVVGNERGGLALFKSASFGNISISEFNKVKEIRIYPNPAQGQFTLDLTAFNLTDIENSTMKLIDLSGRVLVEQNLTNQFTQIDASELSKGTYLVVVSGINFNVTEKLIVN